MSQEVLFPGLYKSKSKIWRETRTFGNTATVFFTGSVDSVPQNNEIPVKFLEMEVDAKVIFYGAIAFMVFEYLWELYLDLRQLKVYQNNKQIPTELIGILSQKTFDKARVYALDKSKFNIATDAFSFACNLLFIFYNGLVIFWNFGGSAVKYFGYESSEMLQNVVFVVTLNVVKMVTALPFSVYYTFVLEEKHGFNNETVSFFIRDKIKMHIFQQLVSVILICGITYLNIGDYFFIYLWIFVMLMTLFLYTIYPEYIAPLFDKYTPLPDGELRTEIEKLAQSVNFPLYKLYVVEGSKRSAHSNAYFYGLFKNKRIVLFDTLLKDYTPENNKATAKRQEDNSGEKCEKKGCDTNEVLAVLGHELGHWKLNHITKNLIIAQANLLLVFTVFGMLFRYKPLYVAFGFYDSQPMLIGLLIVSVFICFPYFQLLNFCLAILSRRFEFQADAFAKSLGRGNHLKLALIKLNADNLSFPIYDPWYSKWHHSHPPLLQRLQALDKDD